MGEMKPGRTVTIPLIPRLIPAKFGEISTKLAKGPEETDPWTMVARVKKVTAAIAFSPKYANPNTKIPLRMQHEAVASFLTFVVLIFSVLKR